MKDYTFETANSGTCHIDVCGAWHGGSADVAVSCDGGYYREWDEIDAGAVEDMFADLLSNGVRFESGRSLLANMGVVGSVMLDRDSTLYAVLSAIGQLSDDRIADLLDSCFGTQDVTA